MLCTESVRGYEAVDTVVDFLNGFTVAWYRPDQLITIEGINGSGKTGLAVYLADDLWSRGRKPVVLRGSGTTNIEDLTQFVMTHYRDTEQEELLEMLNYQQTLQQRYALYDWSSCPAEKAEAAVAMQRGMFEMIHSAIGRGYLVIADRGAITTLLGGLDKFGKAGMQQVISQLGTIPMSASLYVRVEPTEAYRRVFGKGEVPEAIEVFEYQAQGFDGVFGKLQASGSQTHPIIDGNADEQTVRSRAIDHVRQWLG